MAGAAPPIITAGQYSRPRGSHMKAQRPSIRSRIAAAWARSPEHDVWVELRNNVLALALLVLVPVSFILFARGTWDMLRDLFR